MSVPAQIRLAPPVVQVRRDLHRSPFRIPWIVPRTRCTSRSRKGKKRSVHVRGLDVRERERRTTGECPAARPGSEPVDLELGGPLQGRDGVAAAPERAITGRDSGRVEPWRRAIRRDERQVDDREHFPDAGPHPRPSPRRTCSRHLQRGRVGSLLLRTAAPAITERDHTASAHQAGHPGKHRTRRGEQQQPHQPEGQSTRMPGGMLLASSQRYGSGSLAASATTAPGWEAHHRPTFAGPWK